MTDYELVQKSQMGDKSAELELWNKYEPLRIKKHNELLNLTNRKFDKEEYDEWTQTAYEKFKNQMAGVRLNDIKKPDTWTIWIRLNGYWNSMNRDIISHAKKKYDNEVAAEISVKEGDTLSLFDQNSALSSPNEFIPIAQDIVKKAFQKTLDELSDKQRKLFILKSEGETMASICKKCAASRKDAEFALKFGQEKLKGNIAELSKKYAMSYDDIKEALS
ncbi:MAG: sigma-70 family RNA polymerase sigma factor [Campylobacter sp.]|nr:sigma-70 family RNA polymerase sigma factor [Campylobacter sp.]